MVHNGPGPVIFTTSPVKTHTELLRPPSGERPSQESCLRCPDTITLTSATRFPESVSLSAELGLLFLSDFLFCRRGEHTSPAWVETPLPGQWPSPHLTGGTGPGEPPAPPTQTPCKVWGTGGPRSGPAPAAPGEAQDGPEPAPLRRAGAAGPRAGTRPTCELDARPRAFPQPADAR